MYRVLETYKDKKGIKVKEGQPMNFFCISCAPWLDYAAYCPVNYGGSPNLFPIITFGKYTEENGKYTLPYTITISHACMEKRINAIAKRASLLIKRNGT